MVSYNIKRVVTGNGTWTNKTRNAMLCDHIWSGQLVTSVWFSMWQKKKPFYQLFVKNLRIKTAFCKERVRATGEHAKTRWFPRVASGSIRLCQWGVYSECVGVWDHSAWVIPNNWHISCTASTILCVKWEGKKNTHSSFCVASDYLDCQKNSPCC